MTGPSVVYVFFAGVSAAGIPGLFHARRGPRLFSHPLPIRDRRSGCWPSRRAPLSRATGRGRSQKRRRSGPRRRSPALSGRASRNPRRTSRFRAPPSPNGSPRWFRVRRALSGQYPDFYFARRVEQPAPISLTATSVVLREEHELQGRCSDSRQYRNGDEHLYQSKAAAPHAATSPDSAARLAFRRAAP